MPDICELSSLIGKKGDLILETSSWQASAKRCPGVKKTN